jgi:streptogramin lyase
MRTRFGHTTLGDSHALRSAPRTLRVACAPKVLAAEDVFGGTSVTMHRLRFAALMALVGALSTDAPAFVRRGDVVLAQSGSLIRLDPATGVMLPLGVRRSLGAPSGLVVLPDGDLIVSDWFLPRPDAGSVIRVHPLDGSARTLASGAPLANPFSLAVTGDGRVVLGDIDAGTEYTLANGVRVRKGMLFELDPATGGLVRRVPDCCDWNPLGLAPVGQTRLVVTDAGCCAYSGPGQLALADVATGTWTPLATPVPFRDPVGVAVGPDGRTAWVVEAALVEPGPPAIRAVDLVTATVTTLLEGPPLDRPTGIVLDDDGTLLVADGGLHAVLRIDPVTAAVSFVAQGPPIDEPLALVRVDAGETVSGVAPGTALAAICSATASRRMSWFAADVLRCIRTEPDGDLAGCLDSASGRFVRRPPALDCPACIGMNASRLAAALPDALVRTPGGALTCGGTLPSCRRRLWRPAARLFRDLAGCDATHVAAGVTADAVRFDTCRSAATTRFLRVHSHLVACPACDDAVLLRIAEQVASLVDALTGTAYCAS